MTEDTERTASLNALWARTLTHGFISAGVKHAVYSPGSRNTPVLLALDHMAHRGELQTHLVLDERTAGFLALGVARITGEPTLLSCTSGSAAANYLPAIVEARQDGLPLIVLTADRPPERHGVGDGQTMPQQSLYGVHAAAFYEPGTPHPDVDLRYLTNLAARAVDAARQEGPVQINLQFRKPLWDGQHAESDASEESADPPSAPRIVRGPPTLTAGQLDELTATLTSAQRGVLVVGPGDLPGPRRSTATELGDALQTLAARLGWPILAEASSAAVFTDTSHLLRGVDLLFRTEQAPALLQPDLVLRFGQLPSSRPVFEWLQSLSAEQILVDPRGRWNDPDLTASTLLVASPVELCTALSSRLQVNEDREWLNRTTNLNSIALSALNTAVNESDAPWGASVASAILQDTPPGVSVHVASSLAVRDMDSFGADGAASRLITASRGVNGIDGTIATAFGQHLADPADGTVVWLGDLAALHDIGSLITLSAQHPDCPPFVVVIVDNGGGGIFDHLPIKAHPAFEKLFITPQPASRSLPGSTTDGHRLESTESLRFTLRQAMEAPGLHLLVVDVAREIDLAQREKLVARLETDIRTELQTNLHNSGVP